MFDLQRLVDAADEAALLRAVDGLASSREWDALEDLARRCRDAVELGKQLWSVAMYIEYRLAWEGPAEHAGRAVAPGAGRFALGPLSEVAASTHTWEELAPHLADPASRAAVAQERVLRGERPDERSLAPELPPELPLELTDFEPAYALPEYRDRSARFPAPASGATPTAPAEPLRAGVPRFLDRGGEALRDTVATWTSESSATSRVATVRGDGPDAVGALVHRARLEEISGPAALALLQWAGASGAARGRRRGGAAGRFAAWWAAANLAGLEWLDDVGTLADDLEEALEELRFWRWAPEEPETGWVLRLAVADPLDGLGWAIEATDHIEEDA